MSVLKKVSLIFSAYLLKLTLFGLALVFAASAVLGTPDTIKTSLEEAGTYNEVVVSLLASAEAEQGADEQSLPLDRPEIRAAAEAAFSPELLQQSANSFIDGIYGWLDGNTEEPQFRVDFSGAKQSFIERVADYGATRLAGLRACTAQENFELANQTLDPFTATCRPPVDVSGVKQQVIRELETSPGFLDDPVLTAADLPSDGKQDFADNFARAPTTFQWGKRLPIILGVISLLLGAIVILLHDDKRRGTKRLAIILLATGVFLTVSTLIFIYLLKNVSPVGSLLGGTSQETGSGMQAAFSEAISLAYNAFSKQVIAVAIVYGLIGGGILLLLYLQRRQKARPTISA